MHMARDIVNILPFFIIQFIINQTVLFVTSVPIRYMPEVFLTSAVWIRIPGQRGKIDIDHIV